MQVLPGLIKIMTVMLRYLPKMVICSMSCVPEVSTATGALEFISNSLDMIEELGIDLKTILVRLDSAHDSAEIIEELTARFAPLSFRLCKKSSY